MYDTATNFDKKPISSDHYQSNKRHFREDDENVHLIPKASTRITILNLKINPLEEEKL